MQLTRLGERLPEVPPGVPLFTRAPNNGAALLAAATARLNNLDVPLFAQCETGPLSPAWLAALAVARGPSGPRGDWLLAQSEFTLTRIKGSLAYCH